MNKLKVCLDIIMSIIMIVLMKTNITGIQLHEIFGIIIFVLFLIHKFLNFKFIKAILTNFFNPKIKFRSKLMILLDILLFVFMTSNIVTGILISKTILTSITVNDVYPVTILHKFFAWWSLIIISIHIGLHIDRLVKYLTKKYEILNKKIIKNILLFIYIIIFVLGVNSISKYSIYSKIIPLNSENEIKQDYNREFRKGYYGTHRNNKYHQNNYKYGNQERQYKNRSNVIDILNIIFLFIGVTYYIDNIATKRNKKTN